MKKIASVLVMTGLAGMLSSQAYAVTFTPDFTDYSFPGTQFNVDAAANTFFSTNYGISIENAYLYVDSRDTFDGIGVSNGLLENNFVPNQTARINFLDTTDFVNLDIFTILDTTYTAYRQDGSVIASVLKSGGLNEVLSFTGGGSLISYITFTSDGGFGNVSGLTYNYDGITDGDNTDLNPVPVPAALPLMASALGFFAVGLRRKNLKS
ncbi:MAG: PEP-CTERM sorting domain-containing protein [Pseudomonadota bacterium]